MNWIRKSQIKRETHKVEFRTTHKLHRRYNVQNKTRIMSQRSTLYNVHLFL